MIITLSGPNGFMLRCELKKLVDEFVKEHGGFALEKIDGEEVEYPRITEALQSLPFLASKKLVVLKKPGVHKSFQENFESLLNTIPESVDVIIVEPKLDKRLVYYKTLKKSTDYRECAELDEPSLVNWTIETAKAAGGSLARGDAAYLVNRLGTDQYLLHNELEKLLAHDPNITREHIDLLSEPTPRSSVFELLDAAFSGNTKRAIELYRGQRAQKMEPLYILSMIAWQLHILAIVKTAGDRPPAQIASENKLSPYAAQKALKVTKNLTLKDIKTLVNKALELDIRLKSESINADDALIYYLLTISKPE